LAHDSGAKVELLGPRGNPCRFPATTDWGTRRANIAIIDPYATTIFTELGYFFEV
jgi:hypothetical protein